MKEQGESKIFTKNVHSNSISYNTSTTERQPIIYETERIGLVYIFVNGDLSGTVPLLKSNENENENYFK